MINKIAAKLLAFQHIFLGAEPPGDIDGLIQLIDELNQGTDLTVKFKTNSKIIKYLVDYFHLGLLLECDARSFLYAFELHDVSVIFLVEAD